MDVVYVTRKVIVAWRVCYWLECGEERKQHTMKNM